MGGLSYYEQVFYYCYFIIHIPITVAIDSYGVIPPSYHPASKLVEWHIRQNNDFLMFEKPTWLFWFIVIELVVQLPLFFYFIKAFRSIWSANASTKDQKSQLHERKSTLYRWLRIYGVNASVTTLICIITVFQRGYYPDALGAQLPMSFSDKMSLVSVYLPTFLIPLRLSFV